MPIKRINPNRIKSIGAYIASLPEKRFTIAELSLHFDIKPTTLKAAFKAHFGVPIHQYQLQVSMHKAREYLKAGKQVKETALHFGYRHIGNFSRAFKRVHKTPPEVHKQ
ncbi:helix-turn-helix transcriptional regulator [Chitinophaga rhizophila]|uniref:AraC family transcriptional regulator n=1 Tax=Chitinophaga rhizophila TaxID=2866212 RepID=A0ABS7G5X9_9BACT|nr:AraC family transcriptional regulator [Chitinophaga rhizophila]MBW8683044.1 AraC family transcriptional regulator [Chitinophaga rhizophila]